MTIWQGLAGPRGLPRDVSRALGAATDRFLSSQSFRARLAELGLNPLGGSADTLAGMVQAEIAKYRDIAARTGIVFE